MIRIRGPTDLPSINDPDLRRLIQLRLMQLSDGEPYDPTCHGELYVAEPTDTVGSLQDATGALIATNPFDGLRFGHPAFAPSHEFVEEHETSYEICFVLGDEGAVAIFVPKYRSIDPQLTSYCQIYAVPAAIQPR